MIKYVLKVTFYAGSDDPEDTDKGTYVLSVDKKISKKEMEKIFAEVNYLLDPYEEKENEDFPLSYEDGLNIDTLMDGIELYTKGKVDELGEHGYGFFVEGVYEIEQWQ